MWHLRDQRPYLSNGISNPWLSDYIEVPEVAEFDPAQHGLVTEEEDRRNSMGSQAPGTPRSDCTGLSQRPGHIIVYDSTDKPLLVSVADPEQVAVLPAASDYFIERHSANKKEFVSSPALGLMAYAPLLL